MTARVRKADPKCGFCGRPASKVRLLLTGRIKGSFICDVCILKAMHGLIDKFTEAGKAKPWEGDECAECGDILVANEEGQPTCTCCGRPGPRNAEVEAKIDDMANGTRLTRVAKRLAIAAGADWPSLDGDAQDAWLERAIEHVRARGAES